MVISNDKGRKTATTATATAAPEAKSNAELQAEIDRLRSQLAEANRPKALSAKTSEKGAISVYGLGRFPVTLYASQWKNLLDHCRIVTDTINADSADKISYHDAVERDLIKHWAAN